MTELTHLPHHDGSALYVSTETPALGETVRVRLRVPARFGAVEWVRVRSNPDREPLWSEASIIDATEHVTWWQADVVVANPVHGYRFALRTADGRVWWVNAEGVFDIETPDANDFRLVTHAPAPDWVRQTVLYQAFPDRFARSAGADARDAPAWARPASWNEPVIGSGDGVSTQFYGGDLDGIREHLDHLVSLGVTTLYLTPFFPAGSNHRYDASSFDEVDPLLGGDEALIRLVEAAHENGLRVVGDLTSNHSGDTHEWFLAAHHNPSAPESDFYLWLDDENNDYVGWLGHKSLPKFNWASAELRRRFIEGPDSVVARWLKAPFNLDGWRIDVANMTGRHLDQDLNAEVRQIIRRTMTEVNPDTILLGESTNDAASDFQGDAWHGAMTYANFTRPVWEWLGRPGSAAGGGLCMADNRTTGYTGDQLYRAHRQFAAGFPWRVRLGNMNALDTHDTPRFSSVADAVMVPVALGLSLTLPGIPVVWAGAELGLGGVNGEDARRPMPWELLESSGDGADRDSEDGSVGGVGGAESSAAIAARERLELYTSLIALRREHPVLSGGGMRWLSVTDDALVFVREGAEESVVVLASRAATVVSLTVGALDVGDGHPLALFGDAEVLTGGEAGSVAVVTQGPTFAAWRFPGVAG
ncbi:glycoside hydrolase family 13 protein [Lysinibacter cavernae]|uniref:Alpha-glucosidase n=1 Tax=Lysinibacter cavernae TaxID=1640652 RepID=A0A7X5TUC1_9MICO|nr:glycoside hydrolase family 13 protein [Lysinibacter cavernae]NIH54414.1 alpha-glucosidase [Lysinibacter cavernae]